MEVWRWRYGGGMEVEVWRGGMEVDKDTLGPGSSSEMFGVVLLLAPRTNGCLLFVVCVCCFLFENY